MTQTARFRCAKEDSGRPQHKRCANQCESCRTQFGPPGPPTRRRNVLGEAQRIREAARGIAESEPLIAFTQMRAQRLSGEYVGDPMEVRMDRDRIRDQKEEAADAVNHGNWWLDDHLDHPDVLLVFEAMRCFVRAYDLLSRVESDAT